MNRVRANACSVKSVDGRKAAYLTGGAQASKQDAERP